MHCFMSPEFGWEAVLYTIDRPDSTARFDLYIDPKEVVTAGPYQPKVSCKGLQVSIFTAGTSILTKHLLCMKKPGMLCL